MKALPPLPRELAEEPEPGRLPPGAPLVFIVVPALIFWGTVAALFWHR